MKKQSKSNLPDKNALALVAPLGNPAPVAKSVLDMLAPQEAGEGRIPTLERLTLPPIVPPAKVGCGVAIEGTVLRWVESPVTAYRSELLVMRHPSGQEYCWPVTAVTRGALAAAQKVKRDAVDLDKAVGMHLIIKGLGSKMMPAGEDGRSRSVNLYEVFAVKEIP